MIQELIDTTLILESLQAAAKTDALEEMLAVAIAHKRLTKPRVAVVRKLLAEREALGSTGIGNGVAVPHVKVDGVDKTLMILARSEEGIEYEAIDGRPVHAVFLLVAPKDSAEGHLVLLRWISGLARSADFRRFLKHAGGEAEIRDLLKEMSAR